MELAFNGSMTEAMNQLQDYLATAPLPVNLKERLTRDANGGKYYQRVPSVDAIPALAPNGSYCGFKFGGIICRLTTLVEEGTLGMMEVDGKYYFLAPGYHTYAPFGRSVGKPCSLNVANSAVTFGPLGFLTVTDGNIGVLQVNSDFKLLAPGSYYWNSPCVRYINSVDITATRAELGPYSLLQVPIGVVAVTFRNGELIILGHEREGEPHKVAEGRQYFLEDTTWKVSEFLPTQTQTDRLEGNDLLSKDNVELLMVAMSQWRIVNPYLAIQRCDSNMKGIRNKVNNLIRATIARIVAGTNIGAGPVSGANSGPVQMGVPVNAQGKEETSLSQLMQSAHATKHMAELVHHATNMGIEVAGVYVPEKRMKNDDIRQEVAKQAVIGIKAEADRSAADAKAYATVRAANAEAEAIETLAKAHASAGERLGAPNCTAARLALTEVTSKALQGAKMTIFSGSPDRIPFLLSEKA